MTTRDSKMVIASCAEGYSWGAPVVRPYGPLALEPAATILNYSQGIFEGLKAFRTEKGRIVLFRPQKNGQRLADGARRLLMPPVPTSVFLEAINLFVRENADLVPPVGKGALYLRPILFGSGADLGLRPSSEYSLVIYGAPVGKYFSGSAGARMQVCKQHQRAAPIGVGHIKSAGNYAPCFSMQYNAKSDGFSDIIYLDVDGHTIDEAAASNFFCVTEDNVVHTPQLGTILPGVTRDSIIQLVQQVRDSRDMDLQLHVGKIGLDTAFKAKEAFLTGTAASISPVGHLASDTEARNFPAPGPVTQMLFDMLQDIQLERAPDAHGWLHDPFAQTFGLNTPNRPNFASFAEPSF